MKIYLYILCIVAVFFTVLYFFSRSAWAQVPNARNEQTFSLSVGSNLILPTVPDATTVRRVNMQNQSTDALACSFASQAPSLGSVGFILKAATSATSGDGGTYSTSANQNDNSPLYCAAATAGDKLWAAWQ